MNTKTRFSLLAILSLVIFSVNICAQTPTADLLDIQFNADGTATDVSGKSHPIVSSQTRPSVAYNNVYKRNAATFTGTKEDYYYFDYSDDQAFINEVSGDFTMECLMRIDDLSKESTPFCTTERSGFGFDISWYSGNDLSFLIHDGSNYVAVADKSIEEGKYYHAVGVVRPNDAVSFYVNGKLIGTSPFTTVKLPGNSAKRLYIGSDVNGSGNPEFAFKGEVVVARMYSKALTEKEVQSVYDALSSTTGALTADLLDVRFNADGTAIDMSGQNHPIVASDTRPSVAYNNVYKRNAATFTGTREDYYYFDYSDDQAFINEVSGDFTMECLMRIDDLSKESTPFSTTERSGFGFDISWYSDNDLSFMIHDGSQYAVVTDKSMEVGKYYHAVGVVKPNDAISFYINGKLIGTSPFTTVTLPGNTSRKLYIGCDVDRSGNPEFAFKGEVVVARMYSKALTEKEVQSVYDALQNGISTDILYYKDDCFDDSSIYTLTGIRVAQPQARGIYIINGKKVFKK